MNKTEIHQCLIARGYTEQQASRLAEDLTHIDTSLQGPMEQWMADGSETDHSCHGISIADLRQRFGMKYPAALLTLDWLVRDPDTALTAIRKGIR